MQISQLQVSHDGVQDRLVLRIATSAREEIRAWITRRFLRELWMPLVGVMRDHLSSPPQVASAPAAAATTPPGNFDEAFRDDNQSFPLGMAPLLVSEVKMEPSGPDLVRMTLREGRERSFTMNLNANLIQALCSMLRATSAQAKWDLDLGYDAERGGTVGDAAPSEPTRKKLLH